MNFECNNAMHQNVLSWSIHQTAKKINTVSRNNVVPLAPYWFELDLVIKISWCMLLFAFKVSYSTQNLVMNNTGSHWQHRIAFSKCNSLINRQKFSSRFTMILAFLDLWRLHSFHLHTPTPHFQVHDLVRPVKLGIALQ